MKIKYLDNKLDNKLDDSKSSLSSSKLQEDSTIE